VRRWSQNPTIYHTIGGVFAADINRDATSTRGYLRLAMCLDSILVMRRLDAMDTI
jgi:hypothetical protein